MSPGHVIFWDVFGIVFFMPHPLASLGRKVIIKALFSLNTELSGSGTQILHLHLCGWSCSMYGHRMATSDILPVVTG